MPRRRAQKDDGARLHGRRQEAQAEPDPVAQKGAQRRREPPGTSAGRERRRRHQASPAHFAVRVRRDVIRGKGSKRPQEPHEPDDSPGVGSGMNGDVDARVEAHTRPQGLCSASVPARGRERDPPVGDTPSREPRSWWSATTAHFVIVPMAMLVHHWSRRGLAGIRAGAMDCSPPPPCRASPWPARAKDGATAS